LHFTGNEKRFSFGGAAYGRAAMPATCDAHGPSILQLRLKADRIGRVQDRGDRDRIEQPDDHQQPLSTKRYCPES
jgi:hypothetical protein